MNTIDEGDAVNGVTVHRSNVARINGRNVLSRLMFIAALSALAAVGCGGDDGTTLGGVGMTAGTTGAPTGASGTTGAPTGTAGTAAPTGTAGTGAPTGAAGTAAPTGAAGTAAPIGTAGTGDPTGIAGTGIPTGAAGMAANPAIAGTGATAGTGAATTAGTGAGATAGTGAAAAAGTGSMATAGAGAAAGGATLTAVFAIMQTNCVSCHGMPANEALNGKLGMIKDKAQFHAAVVGKPLQGVANMCMGKGMYVVPGNPAMSMLLQKTMDPPPCGAQMAPGNPLSEADTKTITDWIMAGAPNN